MMSDVSHLHILENEATFWPHYAMSNKPDLCISFYVNVDPMPKCLYYSHSSLPSLNVTHHTCNLF